MNAYRSCIDDIAPYLNTLDHIDNLDKSVSVTDSVIHNMAELFADILVVNPNSKYKEVIETMQDASILNFNTYSYMIINSGKIITFNNLINEIMD